MSVIETKNLTKYYGKTWTLAGLGILYGLLFIALAFIKYNKKDITA